MTIEHASMRPVPKPWGSRDLLPFSRAHHDDEAIGEVWFERSEPGATTPALLLKLLFTTAPLSIQVHPGDEFARSIGLPRGKTEAWYILSAKPGARIAVGLKHSVSHADLKTAVENGSIVDLIQWREAAEGEVILVPAGTIHAIGAGLVVAEVQQSSDATFRIYDYGSDRALHIDDALAVAIPGPAQPSAVPRRLTRARTLLVASPFFVMERIELPPGSNWTLDAGRETWILVLEGEAEVGSAVAIVGEAIFADNEQAGIRAGTKGLTALVAYAGDQPITSLLRNIDDRVAGSPDADAASLKVQDSPLAVSPTRLTEAQP